LARDKVERDRRNQVIARRVARRQAWVSLQDHFWSWVQQVFRWR
jgi:hypothetical protein